MKSFGFIRKDRVTGRPMVRNGKAVIGTATTSDNPSLPLWRQLVAEAAGKVATGELFTGPVALTVTFYLPRPKSASRRVLYPAKRPDVSKLVRSTEDALKHVLWEDDSQVVDLVARKRFADLESPVGVLVTVSNQFGKVSEVS